MKNITAREIVREARMCDDPSYYSGYRARRHDLSGERLIIIHKKIKEELGENQAKEFVTMIKEISSLSATNFLKQLYAMEENGWKYSEKPKCKIDLGTDGNKTEAIGFATVCCSLTGPDETEIIRREFFEKYLQ